MMHDAFKIWDNAAEPLASVEARIHDGAPIEHLTQRAAGYVNEILKFSLVRLGAESSVVEVGSGVGYIMEAMARRNGLNRIERARERLSRDKVTFAEFDFKLYDGKVFPWADGSIDFFYSVATIQHIPKPYAYNVIFEINRCIKPGGGAVVHLLGWDQLSMYNFSFADEIKRQLGSQVTHWHHFYDQIELQAISDNVLKPSSVRITPVPGSIWLSWVK
jgi:SAM-dependent methyltransferase